MDSKRYPELSRIVAASGLLVEREFTDERLQGYQQSLISENPAEWAEALKEILERQVHDSIQREFAIGFVEELLNATHGKS